ncbi:phytanoyl-CoA dioxygenase family protein [Nocardia abscessus]|uniref:phytanoyl-CoA dioxygenase family protein n=1 Tax=Nocardia abscessus TaxID=120957 RepID=UPI0024565C6F|nr:phytanoyl-CoA dioxygenase family protein [Nocardia abscessus]
MSATARYRADDSDPIIDPTTGSGEVRLFQDGFGQEGMPFVMHVSDPPNKTRSAHYHHGDVIYVYTAGEHHIEGEGLYRAGDIRWTRAGHVYGPETTGPEGGSWWIISYSDPIPVDVGDHTAEPDAEPAGTGSVPAVPRFREPYDWPAIDASVREHGAVVVEGLIAEHLRSDFTAELDAWLREHTDAGQADSGSALYDSFLGRKTLRLHGLAAKIPASGALIAHPDLRAWATRMLAPVSSGIQLNAGELIEIGPGEPAQYPHRDNDSWPHLPHTTDSVLVNAMIALTPFTEENGATNIALGSHEWPIKQNPAADQLVRAVMAPGDVLLFRGDAIHGGGANRTTDERRRGLSLSYCAGWLRPVENSVLNVPPQTAVNLSPEVQALLGYAAHDATAVGGGMLGLYENGDPGRVLFPSA